MTMSYLTLPMSPDYHLFRHLTSHQFHWHVQVFATCHLQYLQSIPCFHHFTYFPSIPLATCHLQYFKLLSIPCFHRLTYFPSIPVTCFRHLTLTVFPINSMFSPPRLLPINSTGMFSPPVTYFPSIPCFRHPTYFPSIPCFRHLSLSTFRLPVYLKSCAEVVESGRNLTVTASFPPDESSSSMCASYLPIMKAWFSPVYENRRILRQYCILLAARSSRFPESEFF